MKYITALLAFASTSVASPLSVRQEEPSEPTIPADWTWHVENWHAGCARAGCNYNFNITVPTIPNKIQGVKAYCSGYETMNDNYFIPCQILEGVNNGVSAKFGNRDGDSGGGPEKIYFSFEKAPYEPTESPGWNFTGEHAAVYNAFVSPLLDFDVTPSEVVVVE